MSDDQATGKNPSIKEVSVEGERYQAEVPDTLDLADRMTLAHALQGRTTFK